MTIKQQGGVFGRNPTFNDVDVEGNLTTKAIDAGGFSISGGTINASSFDAAVAGAELNLGVTGNTSVKYIKFNEATDWSIQSNGSSYLRIYSGGSEAARFDGSQNFSMVNGGNILMASGNGIDFSATAGTGTSELFNDYEEGTWTPVVADATSGGNEGTASVTNGYYTKIGNIVHATCQLVNIDTTGLTAGNNVYITGLPFTAVTVTSTALFVSAATTLNVAFSDTPNAVVQDATNYVTLAENVSGGAYDFIVVSELTSGSARIYFTLTYQAA